MPDTFAVQLLDAISPEDAIARLRAASEVVPLSAAILGWDSPEVVEEVRRLGAAAFRCGAGDLRHDGVFLDYRGGTGLDRAAIEESARVAHEAGLEVGLGCTFDIAIAQDLMILDYHCDWMMIVVDSLDPQTLFAEMTRAREVGITSMYAALDLAAEGIAQRYRALRAAVPNGFILTPDLSRIPVENLKLIEALRKAGSR
jgi:hypothetical protein